MKLSFQSLDENNFKDFLEFLNAIKAFEGDPVVTKDEIQTLKDEQDQYGVRLAYLDSEAIAFALYFKGYSSFKCGPTLFIDDLYVAKEHRGKGVGARVFEECVRIAKEHGTKRVEWTTRNTNYDAQDFYESLGAKKSNKIFYRMEEDEIKQFTI